MNIKLVVGLLAIALFVGSFFYVLDYETGKATKIEAVPKRSHCEDTTTKRGRISHFGSEVRNGNTVFNFTIDEDSCHSFSSPLELNEELSMSRVGDIAGFTVCATQTSVCSGSLLVVSFNNLSIDVGEPSEIREVVPNK